MYGELFSNTAPASPVDDSDGFAMPASAAAPSQIFEDTLTLSNTTSSGSFRPLRNDEKIDTGTASPWRHLASFSFKFVQNGSYLIPVRFLGASYERVRRELCAFIAEWGNLLHLQRRGRMGVAWGSERDQQDRALLSLTGSSRNGDGFVCLNV